MDAGEGGTSFKPTFSSSSGKTKRRNYIFNFKILTCINSKELISQIYGHIKIVEKTILLKAFMLRRSYLKQMKILKILHKL